MVTLERSENIKGFTLVELLVVVVILSILAAVAIPSYQAYIEDGRRSECQAFALDIASRQERHWTQQSTYGNLDAGSPESSEGAGDAVAANNDLGMPNGNQSENGYCSAIVVGGDSFTIQVTMTPADTECGVLTLRNTGERTSERGNAAECWR